MQLKKNGVYTDSKYNCDVQVRKVRDSVVLIEEIDSGNNRLYGREEFDEENERFLKKE